MSNLLSEVQKRAMNKLAGIPVTLSLREIERALRERRVWYVDRETKNRFCVVYGSRSCGGLRIWFFDRREGISIPIAEKVFLSIPDERLDRVPQSNCEEDNAIARSIDEYADEVHADRRRRYLRIATGTNRYGKRFKLTYLRDEPMRPNIWRGSIWSVDPDTGKRRLEQQIWN